MRPPRRRAIRPLRQARRQRKGPPPRARATGSLTASRKYGARALQNSARMAQESDPSQGVCPGPCVIRLLSRLSLRSTS